MSDLDLVRTVCACCEGVGRETPEGHRNRPGNRQGLGAIDYRVGTHGRFKASMLSGIAARDALSALTTRRDDDWTIAFLDAWAVALDVLTFYQERIANEGFLRTATERRSLLELARLVGYEPRSGVSATTHLAFRVSSSALPAPPPGTPVRPGAVVLPPLVTIPAGTRAQSASGPGELPQPFETSEELAAREEWNELRPRLTEPQLFDRGTRKFFLEGTATGLAKGDWVLVNAPESADPESPGDFAPTPLRVAKVRTDDAKGWTEVRLIPQPTPVVGFVFFDFLKNLTAPAAGLFLGGGGQRTDSSLQQAAAGFHLSGTQVTSLGTIWNVAPAIFGKLLGLAEPKAPKDAGFFALRVRSNPFGHNAPRWRTLPRSWRVSADGKSQRTIRSFHLESGPPPYGDNWDDSGPPRVHQDSQGNPYTDSYPGDDPIVLLERAFDEVVPGSWLVLRNTGPSPGGGGETAVYKVKATEAVSRADFGLTGEATRVTLEGPLGDGASGFDRFRFRNTEIHTASEELTLARVPVEGDVAGRTVDLDGVLEIQLEPGRLVAVTGERTDLEGVEADENSGIVASEIAVLEATETLAGFTRLTFEEELTHSYRRESVTLNANVAPASHGESRREVLGSGDASRPFQRFALKHAPLTHLPAPVPSGGAAALEVRVRGVRWHEAPDFYRLGPPDRRYVLRRADDGTTAVHFGDGLHGARLPTGESNVTAAYRSGIGLAGHLDAGRISLLATRPLGVDEVVNPVPARGGADPEPRDRVRSGAPLTVRTLDRIVSLEDFADFARAFGGIGKAHAARVWDGERWVVHVTVTAADGGEAGETLRGGLRDAMDAAREPHAPLVIGTFRPRFFEIEARLHVHPDHVQETVLAAADAALRAAYAFEARELGQRVASSDVIARLHGVEGVVAVDLERFQRLDADEAAPAGAPAVARHLDALPAGLVSAPEGPVLAGTEMLLLALGPVPLIGVESLVSPEEGSP